MRNIKKDSHIDSYARLQLRLNGHIIYISFLLPLRLHNFVLLLLFFRPNRVDHDCIHVAVDVERVSVVTSSSVAVRRNDHPLALLSAALERCAAYFELVSHHHSRVARSMGCTIDYDDDDADGAPDFDSRLLLPTPALAPLVPPYT